MSKFIDEVNEEQERYSPVRTAVKAAAGDIQAAREAGKPLNAIFRTLKRKGQSVGAGYSSFRNAVLYLDRHGWPDTVADPSPMLMPTLAPDQPARDRFIDNRHTSDF